MPPERCAPRIRVCAVVCGCDPCCLWALQATISLRFKSCGHVLQHRLFPMMLEFCRTAVRWKHPRSSDHKSAAQSQKLLHSLIQHKGLVL